MKPHVVKIGFNPKKLVSTVSYVCSECRKHVSPENVNEQGQVECEYCHAKLEVNYEEEPETQSQI